MKAKAPKKSQKTPPKTANTPFPGTIARYYYNIGIPDNGSLQNVIGELLDNNYSTKRIIELTGINDDEIAILRQKWGDK